MLLLTKKAGTQGSRFLFEFLLLRAGYCSLKRAQMRWDDRATGNGDGLRRSIFRAGSN